MGLCLGAAWLLGGGSGGAFGGFGEGFVLGRLLLGHRQFMNYTYI